MENQFTNAEVAAEKAENLPAFSGFKLSHIKKQLTLLLSMIGRDGIFDEYTRHDISHINKMLSMLDWLVPEETIKIMSPADWLMTVLAIYFHDLGMLVTKHEYELREASGFPEFKEKNLFAGDTGKDYRAKIEKLGPDRAERFAYQEFVRHSHAERIRAWITGNERDHLGISNEVISELDKLLTSLSLQFRRDLALVCESHHLSDLDDFKKYKTSQPYGDSDDETVNIQYAAVLMRTADLLHMTSDRTPTISYRIINPSDPISQEEWAKQMAVRRVRSKIGVDKEGNPNDSAPRDTIEVHADFKNEDGFFGLTSYLQYAKGQLQKSYEWVGEAIKTQGAKHKFPWRYIDDSHIEALGFIKETFEFTFDQGRILDLLTGHTLYNDIKIVLREIVQNSTDAVRLQCLIDRQDSSLSSIGNVFIHWDSKQRTLLVEDTGTGMTQDIIERNLLKVGSSRYQSEEFRNEYPQFSSISRFGIGILSTFMIADSVEILTCHPDDEEARQLSLRSVHGKYLIRLIDKFSDDNVRKLFPHGTRIVLKVRHSVDMSDIIETARRWIVIPDCDVSLKVDDTPAIKIGFSSPKEAVASYLNSIGVTEEEMNSEYGTVKIIEDKQDDVSIAYALAWSPYFKEWSFLQLYPSRDEEYEEPLLGTCVEGIRVEFNTPGFEGYNIAAIANATGANAPKTNVARSGLESTVERDQMLDAIYSMLCKHVDKEITELHSKRAFSLTWAVQESKYLLSPLINSSQRARPSNFTMLLERIKELPLLLIEKGSQRHAISPVSIQQLEAFWTIDSASFQHAEELLREVAGNSSLTSLIKALGGSGFAIPSEPILCGSNSDDYPDILAYSGKEVVTIRVDHSHRRIDLKWAAKNKPARWLKFPRDIDIRRIQRGFGRPSYHRILELNVGRGDIEAIDISNEIAVRAFGETYLLPNTRIAEYLVSRIDRYEAHPRSRGEAAYLYFIFIVVLDLLAGTIRTPLDISILRKYAARYDGANLDDNFPQDVIDTINDTHWSVFDTSVWLRQKEVSDDIEF